MKMLKTKHFRRIAVFLAMIAPAVYLFGSLFSALAGAHGTQVFAEPVYVDEWVDIDRDQLIDDDGTYRFVLNASDQSGILVAMMKTGNRVITRENFYLNGERRFQTSDVTGSLYSGEYGETYHRLYSYPLAVLPYPLIDGEGVFSLPLPWTFTGAPSVLRSIYDFFEVGTISKIVLTPSYTVPENAGAYSDYVFKNFFAKDNFLVQWGENAISENPRGFAPFGAFWRYLDTNVLHLSNDQMGLMGYGYIYYCSHVLLFDIGFILVTFFLDFIQKVADKFTGGE